MTGYTYHGYAYYGHTLGNMILTGALRPLATATMTYATRATRVTSEGGGGGAGGGGGGGEGEEKARGRVGGRATRAKVGVRLRAEEPEDVTAY